MAKHEYYTGLSASAACALAISGQLSEQEGSEWIEHVGSCAECQQLMRDFMQVSFRLLPEGDAVNGTAQQSVEHVGPKVPAAELSAKRRIGWPGVAALILSAVLCVAAFVVYRRAQNHAPYVQNFTPLHVLTSTEPDTDSQGTKNKLLGDIAEVKEKLRKAQTRVLELERTTKSDQEIIRAADSEKKELLARIDSYESTVADLRGGTEDRDRTIRQLQQDISARELALKAKDSELRTASSRISETEGRLKQERERNIILDRLQALFAAKNLHFADIHDDGVTGNGRFGRVLYAKGLSLMFYAYGLAEGPQLNANVSYHVWGERKEVAKTIRNLGVLQRDNTQLNGWRLTCDDPAVLSQIDSVFVTAERTAERKEVTRPSGNKMLSASLGDTANHP